MNASLRLAEGALAEAGGGMTADAVDVGFPIHSASAEASLKRMSPLLVHVSALHGRALGGDLHVTEFDYDNDVGARLHVELDGLDIAEILALQGASITGTGTLDGHLPVAIDASGVTVTGGEITARPPGGRIRYPDAEASALGQRPEFGSAFRALSDFQYEHLESTVDYAADGVLALAIELKGRSPEVEQGQRPIHLNVNVTQDLPMLLKSLQATSAMERRIVERVIAEPAQ